MPMRGGNFPEEEHIEKVKKREHEQFLSSRCR